ncbi:hypothetical protein C8034_v003127 [Colletotrichum sidae]|uniref:Uncharacterized protein n=1 Tax=Colletotrichum sidae TaxID=1347389 RepID=A0A4R8TAP5_9PEZI|nr:hypothetical protein C8034_v003127 [Colletotrichum sidae]
MRIEERQTWPVGRRWWMPEVEREANGENVLPLGQIRGGEPAALTKNKKGRERMMMIERYNSQCWAQEGGEWKGKDEDCRSGQRARQGRAKQVGPYPGQVPGGGKEQCFCVLCSACAVRALPIMLYLSIIVLFPTRCSGPVPVTL